MRAFSDGTLDADLALVISNVAGAPILQRATDAGYPARLLESRGLSRSDHEARLADLLHAQGVQHLLLAGYMRLLSAPFIAAWRGVILNIHPSLLPDFPGLHAVERQWRAGVRESGATVHYVDAGIDTGPVLLRGRISVRGDEGAAGLAGRILHEVEHALYPRAVRLLLDRLQSGAGPADDPKASTQGIDASGSVR